MRTRIGLVGLAAAIILFAAAPAGAVTVTSFTTGLAATPTPDSVTPGPDGNVWFVDTGAVGRITSTGAIHEFTTGLQAGDTPVDSITAGSDGGMWFAEQVKTAGSKPAIGRIDPATGQIENFVVAENPFDLVEGPDGNIWFYTFGDGVTVHPTISYITPTGMIVALDLPLTSQPEALAPGSDGSMWFLDIGNPYQIGRVTVGTNTVKEFGAADGLDPTAVLDDITAGPSASDAIWYTAEGEIGRVTPAGAISYISAGSNGLQSDAQPDAITLGPDGNLWFDDQYSTHNAVGEVDPQTDQAKEIRLTTNATPWTIAFGADGNLWTVQTGLVASIDPTTHAITQYPTAPTVGTDGDTLTAAPDGNLYANDMGTPKSILQINLDQAPVVSTGAASAVTATSATIAGTVTPLSTATTVTVQYGTTTALGSSAAAGSLAASTTAVPITAALSGLPAGTTIYYAVTATNSAGTISGGMESFTTAAAPAGSGTGGSTPGTGTTPISGTVTPTPQSTTGAIGNQSLTLSSPSTQQCVPNTTRLSATFTTVATGTGKKLRFRAATFTIDRGVKHQRHRTVRRHGKRHRVTVTVYLPDAVTHRAPATETLTISGLQSGAHTLTVKATYTEKRHGHTKTVSKTLRTKFLVC